MPSGLVDLLDALGALGGVPGAGALGALAALLPVTLYATARALVSETPAGLPPRGWLHLSPAAVFALLDDGRLVPWGAPMRTAPLPGMGRWTPDGRLFVVTTITATADMAQAGYRQNASLLAVFAFDDTAEPDSPPRRADDRQTSYESRAIQHARLAHVPAGLGYVETISLSPDGRLLAAANMRASWLPADHPGRSEGSALSLFALDAGTGALDLLATRALPDVVLPQGLAFDADGSHLAVTSFQHDDREGGSLRVFTLGEDEAGGTALAPAGESLALPRGAHFLAVLP
ncbi:MAG: hypothetical protein ACFBWO_12885 [Paracoccaceae bacterium]